MSEYIKRDDALEAIWRILNGMGISQKHNDRLVEEVDAVLDEYQAADVRPVVLGKWEAVMLDHERMGCRPTAHYCSECHQITGFRTFFCPNCGAMMEES